MMGRILDEMFLKCNFANDDGDIFQSAGVKNCDFNLKRKLHNFAGKLSDQDMLDDFGEMCEELLEIQNERDCVLSRAFLLRGMALNMELCTEILREGR